MINIQIDESVDYRSGIYLLEFSDGHFYIGSAKYIKSRIDFHCRCILSNFKQKVVSSKALLKMKDFSGDLKISVLEYIDVETRIYANRRHLLQKEHSYVLKHKDNKYLLNHINRPRKTC